MFAFLIQFFSNLKRSRIDLQDRFQGGAMPVKRVYSLNLHFNKLTSRELARGHCILQLNYCCLFQVLKGIFIFLIRHCLFLFLVKNASKVKLNLANVSIIHYLCYIV